MVRIAPVRIHQHALEKSNAGNRQGLGRKGNNLVMGALHFHRASDNRLLHKLHAAAEEGPGSARNCHLHLRRLVAIPAYV